MPRDRYTQVADAIEDGLRDHGPMTGLELAAFLRGYGFNFDPNQELNVIRQAVYYRKDRLESVPIAGSRQRLYQLKQTEGETDRA